MVVSQFMALALKELCVFLFAYLCLFYAHLKSIPRIAYCLPKDKRGMKAYSSHPAESNLGQTTPVL